MLNNSKLVISHPNHNSTLKDPKFIKLLIATF